MSANARGPIAAIAALIVAFPAVAGGPTGILHKNSQTMMKSLPAGAVPATALPGVADGVEVAPMPAPIDVTLPAPIEGDGFVHIMPIEGGPVQIMPFEAAPGYVGGFEGGAVHALAVGPPDRWPFSHGHATAMAASPGGLEQAARATAMAAGRRAAHPRSLPAGQNGMRRIPERAVGMRPDAVGVPPRGPSSRQPQAAAAAVQRVGSVQPASSPRWRDRLRFAWPGTGD